MLTTSEKPIQIPNNGARGTDPRTDEPVEHSAAPANGLPLTRALEFIREHTSRRLTVSDVVRASGLSRRALEKRFRSSLGRSVLDEIRRSRTEHFAHLLVETDLTVAQIGTMLGFTDVKHLARYFRAAKQMSPSAYRKTFQHLPAETC